MTYIEVKKLLEQIKHKKRLAERIKQEINTLRENYDTLTCPLVGVPNSNTHSQDSPVERLFMRVAEKQEKLAKLLNGIMDLEDKLSEAIKKLTFYEQEIIIGYYYQGKTHTQLAYETHYSRESTFRYKRQAIQKIARYMQS
jgi:DNA-directed RNA polymerase specialized sigma subunit